MPAFNPNAPLAPQRPGQFDFEARQAAIEQRKKLLAAFMRQQEQAQGEAGSEGRMVSGHYVAPSWAEHLAHVAKPLAAQWAASREQKGLQADTEAYAAADKAAAAAHVASRPQGRAELPGPQAEQGSPELGATQPTAQEQAAWAQQGASIPSRRDVVAKLLTDLEVNEPVRQQDRAERRQDREDRQGESRATLKANLQLRREQLQQQADAAAQRSDDMRLAREDRAAAAREANEIRMEIARMGNETRREAIAAGLERAKGATKPVPQSLMKSLGELQDQASTISDLAKSFQPDYSGLTMGARTRAGSYIGTDQDAVEWWKQYRKQSELTERHALFGAALTPTEQESWRNADIGPTTDPKVIQRNLATRAKLAAKLYGTHRDRAIRSGYGGVEDAFQAPQASPPQAATPSGLTGGAGGSWGPPEVPALPKGWSVKTR